MKKETLGAALFFCGLGILFSMFEPMDSCGLRLIVSVILMLAGYKLGSC